MKIQLPRDKSNYFLSPLQQERGNTILIFMFIMSTLAALAVGALQVTTLNLESTHAHRKGKKAFYAAEVGLDLAMNDIMNSFENLSVYTTTAANGGDGEGFLTVNNYRGHDVKYKITNPQSRYLYQTVQGNSILTHYAYTYDVEAESTSLSDNSRESLRETVRILETPLVQWFIFYGGNGGNNSDLEVTPGPGMTIWGRVHSNADIYLRAGCGGQLHIQNYDPNGGNPLSAPHSVTAAGIIRNFHKGGNFTSCVDPRIKTTNTSLIWEDDVPINFFVDTEAEEAGFNDFVFVNEPVIQAPGNSQFVRNDFYDQRAGDPQRADVDGIRILGQGGLGAGMTVEVSRPAANTDVTALVLAGETSAGNPYTGPMPIIRETTGVLNDCREDDAVDTTDIDLYALELWYQEYLADPANGSGTLAGAGFLVYASRSPDASFANTADPMQAIRLMQIGAGSAAQLLDETTFATDNPVYIDGDFNTVSTQGAAIIGDAINFLGNNWNDTKNCGGGIPSAGGAGSTQITVRAALFGGYSPTTAIGGTYGGGLHNYMRYHEEWRANGVTSDFKGSLIGLWTSQQATGNWCQGGDCYQPPVRSWGWDTRFADPDFWPPFIPSIFSVERVGFLE
jgi:Tfp pilus assembly protein PilX